MSDSTSHVFPTNEELAALLPPYEIQCCIQQGLTSAIYLARQTALERAVMIRVMPDPDPALIPQLLDRLRKRARLVDPKIVSVFDFGRTTAGPLYLVTEYVDGGLLEHLILEQQVTPKLAFQLANQLCDALQMVHDQGIIHGALSCRTVLVTRDWHLKLTGIGMSETAEGELSWMEESNATFADDMRALGVVIHEMFSGKSPTDDGQVSSSLPAAFAKLVERCLTPDLTQRYQHPRDVRAALTEALRAEQKASAPVQRSVVSARPAGAPGAPSKPVAAPPRAVPGKPMPPRVAPPKPSSFMKRMDTFFWNTIRTSLHLMIFGVTALILGGIILFKDRISVVDADDSTPSSSQPSGPAKGLDDARKPVKADLGALPAAPNLTAADNKKKKINLPPRPLTARENAYLDLLRKEITSATDEKRADDLSALKRELQRVQNRRGVPGKDEANLPEVLKRLREDYRKNPAK